MSPRTREDNALLRGIASIAAYPRFCQEVTSGYQNKQKTLCTLGLYWTGYLTRLKQQINAERPTYKSAWCTNSIVDELTDEIFLLCPCNHDPGNSASPVKAETMDRLGGGAECSENQTFG